MPTIDQPVQAAPATGPQDVKNRQLSPDTLRVVIAVKEILAQPEIAKQIVDLMRGVPDPALAVAQAVVFLLRQVIAKSKNFPKGIVVAASQEIMADIIKLGTAAKLFTPSQELVKKATMYLVQLAKRAASTAAQAAQAQPAAQPAAQPMVPVAAQPATASPAMGV